MVFLELKFGDPFIFLKAQFVEGWMANVGFNSAIETIKSLWPPINILTGKYSALRAIHLSIFFMSLLISIITFGKFRKALTLWSVFTVLITFSHWNGMGRYVLVIFPVFLGLSWLLREKDELFKVFLYISILFLALFSVMFSRAIWVA